MKKTNWNPSNQNYLTSTEGSKAATAASARQARRIIFKLFLCGGGPVVDIFCPAGLLL